MSRKKQLLGVALVLGVFSLALLVHSVLQIISVQGFNRAIKSDQLEMVPTWNALPARFARAWMLHQKGEFGQALKAYSEIEIQGSGDFKRSIRFNLADLYMQQASLAGRKGEQDIATPLIEMAKHHYRQILREDSHYYQAKYNLETALKILPDLDEAEFPDDVMPERSPESAGSVEIDRELP
ncbi:MAG TPA: hypothetical protein EYH06_13345 [Chromatiales bacterium]|nr:hypothetical protein [Thiotrichales bacterium]HIP69549.1 hypothetical protein [Chromatiales bacterium]